MGWKACRWELIGAWAGVAAVEVVRNGWVLSVSWSCNWQELLTYWTWCARKRVEMGTQVLVLWEIQFYLSAISFGFLEGFHYFWLPLAWVFLLFISWAPLCLSSVALPPLVSAVFWQFTVICVLPSGIRCFTYVAHFLVLVVSGRRINPALKMRVLEKVLVRIMDLVDPSGLPSPDRPILGW